MSEQTDILKLPINYLRYLEWHKRIDLQSKKVASPLFGFPTPHPRFEFMEDDIPKLTPGLQLKAIGTYTLVNSEYGETILELDYKVLSSIIDLIDGSSKADELIRRAMQQNLVVDIENINKLIGIAIILPDVIEELELAIPGISIVRSPFSPYQILRNYWKNMIDVRRKIEVSLSKNNQNELLEQIRSFHIITLMGSNLRTFYKPDSGVSDFSVCPGHFRNGETHVICGFEEFSEYLHIVAHSLDITIKDQWEVYWNDCGQYWGKGFVLDHTGSYTPPDAPFGTQLDQLCILLMALPSIVNEDELPKAISALAKFHQRFVQLHPFECANQSLAMNIINHFLKKWIDSCVPHLHLDMVAFFFTPEDYSRYFARVVKYYAVKTVDARHSYFEFKNRLERVRQCIPILISHFQSKSIENFLEENPDLTRDLLLVD